jgi:Notch 1
MAIFVTLHCSSSSTTGSQDTKTADLVALTDTLTDADGLTLPDMGRTDGDGVEGLDLDVGLDGDVDLFCGPSPGPFGCPCEENGDCQSGYCGFHLGEQICAKECMDQCEPGWNCKPVSAGGADDIYVCISKFPHLCLPCKDHNECRLVSGVMDVCVGYGESKGSFCGGACGEDADCPTGYACAEVETFDGNPVRQCSPDSGECACSETAIQSAFSTPCAITDAWGTCEGTRVCSSEGLTACSAMTPEAEACFNQIDDDCDGLTDLDDTDCMTPCICGDGKCEEDRCGEAWDDDQKTCATDCASCGNLICDPGEGVVGPATCLTDCCGSCGDGLCRGGECGENPGAQTPDNPGGCPEDCAKPCGDDVCDPSEGPATCPEDCQPYACGNQVCEPNESPAICPPDCGTSCGNCACELGETTEACPHDCGYCGDGFCIAACAYLMPEDVDLCPADCCIPVCIGKECGPDGCGGLCGVCPAWDPCRDACKAGHCMPSHAEELRCDGIDEDCDGQTDEDFVYTDPVDGADLIKGEPCGTGVCDGGAVLCAEDKLDVACSTEVEVGGELCDGLDNDCDGVTDAGDASDLLVGDPRPCEVQAGICVGAIKPASLCASGAWLPCDDAVYVEESAQYEAGQETSCDGLDNDCDGETDEDFGLVLLDGSVVSGVGSPCGTGLCRDGQTICSDAGDGLSCSTEVYAGQETCDAMDDDCDGATDAEDTSMAAGPLCENQQGACAGSLKPADHCLSGAWLVCTEAAYAGLPDYRAVDDLCDGEDNDCDGSTDEDYLPEDTTCGVGACAAAGQEVCQEGGKEVDTCAPLADAASEEVCDGIDNDCDGLTDAEDDDLRALPLEGGGLGGGADLPPCELQDGVCQGAIKPAMLCVDGAWQDCNDETYLAHSADYAVSGPDATCDGLDNDCDGVADEDYVVTGTTCGVGACAAAGQEVCQEGGTEVDTCVPLQAAVEVDESCDGIDQDCDGSTDEDYVVTGTACGVGACAAIGQQVCQGGGTEVDTCVPLEGAVEVDESCDGVDQDCDGGTDEDYVPITVECGEGACLAEGTTACMNGTVIDSCEPGDGTGTDLICNGIDDDCDGSTDEDYVVTDTTCGLGACAAAGQQVCQEGGTEVDTCAPLADAASAEVCDGADNDCDGLTDAADGDLKALPLEGGGLGGGDDLPPCELQDGVCQGARKPVSLCVEGAWQDCTDETYLAHSADYAADGTDAVCDGLDNDCDGTINEDYVTTATTCGVGACAATGERICQGGGAEFDTCAPLAAAAEVDASCDGIDQDCDGEDDEDYAVVTTKCGIGACMATGQRVCQGGSQVDSCVPLEAVTEVDESCDGIDQDCDGEVDEDYAPSETTCGIGACAAAGHWVCEEGGVEVDTCMPDEAAASADACDGVDNDCDGLTDAEDVDDLDEAGAFFLSDLPLCPEQRGVCEGAIKPANLCVNGAWLEDCTDELYAAHSADYSTDGTDETCDGLDNDCDGPIDEDYVVTATACGTGACAAAGQRVCQEGGQEVDTCVPSKAAVKVDESCDGVDQDCDGAVDEDYVPTNTTCGQGACAAAGQLVCQEGGEEVDTCVARAEASGEEVCDGADNDCDGLTDAEDSDLKALPLEGGGLGGGADLPPCERQDGVCQGASKPASLCVEGVWQDCTDETYLAHSSSYVVDGTDTVCDGLDNDCDGVVDEDYVVTDTTCGVGACAAAGQQVCQGGGMEVDTCVPLSPPPSEIDTLCDGQDEDCDGLTDEDYVVTDTTCGVGACAVAGQRICQVGGSEVDNCVPNEAAASDEVCDGIDDDCDGTVDNGGDLLCDDGVGCTMDSCDGNAGCDHVADDLMCGDGDDCTVDSCDWIMDCTHNPIHPEGSCGLRLRVLLRGAWETSLGRMHASYPEFYDVTVQLRSAPDGPTLYSTTARLDEDGWGDVDVSAVAPGGYYVVVRHLNHVSAMTAVARDFASLGRTTVDFTAESGAWNQTALSSSPLVLRDSYWMLWPGDVNGDEIVDMDDFVAWNVEYKKCNGTCGDRRADMDASDVIDVSDFSYWNGSFKEHVASHVPGDVERPFALEIEREDDATRQVRIFWQYPGAVDIAIHDGDANGHYIESFYGSTMVSNVTGGTWLDTNAPEQKARYYRVRASDTGHWGNNTLMKWDYLWTSQRRLFGLALDPSAGYELSDLFGKQGECPGESHVTFFDEQGPSWPESVYRCDQLKWLGTAESIYRTRGFVAFSNPGPVTLTTVGYVPRDTTSINVSVNDAFFSTGMPVAVRLGSIDFAGAGGHGGATLETADRIAPMWEDAVYPLDGCWLSTDGHWYLDETGGPCDAMLLLPGRGYWYLQKGGAFSFTIPNSCLSGACSLPDADGDGDPDSSDCGPSDSAIHHRAIERCNGKDDDCDGADDDNYVVTTTECGVGACASVGQLTCETGSEVDSCTPGTPAADDASCDGEDDDCDGAADEDYVPTQTSCGLGACFAAGLLECKSGAEVDSCVPSAASDEACNGIDDDCDGLTDAADAADLLAFDAPGLCEDQVGVCAGITKDQTLCDGANGWLACDDLFYALYSADYETDETSCDGLDNDCDGSTDEDYIVTETLCGIGACAAVGQQICQDGSEVDTCAPVSGGDDVCDGLDNDCDGETDESPDELCPAGDRCVDGQCVLACPTGEDMVDNGDGTVTDPLTCLVWQKTPNAANFKMCATQMGYAECPAEERHAANHCENNDDGLPGADWRLPTISELRSLIKGCEDAYWNPMTNAGGACGVTDDCLSWSSLCHTIYCDGTCLGDHGPGEEGRYIDEIYDFSEHYWFWSLSPIEDDPDRNWCIIYGNGRVYWNLSFDSEMGVRCVRGGPYDPDQDGVLPDGDNSGTHGDNACTGGQTTACDDNCPDVANADQFDTDGDLAGDACDPDDDGDGDPDGSDCAPLDATVHHDVTSDATCDGLDNDCDGATDEDYVVAITTCGVGACAAAGQQVCQGGGTEVDTCVPDDAAAGYEVCDGLDNDCDGLTDAEDIDDIDASGFFLSDLQLCPEQQGVCQGATRPAGICVSGVWESCGGVVYLAHAPERYEAGTELSHDGFDNDCDGQTDEELINPNDPDGDGVLSDGDGSGTAGDVVCGDGQVEGCDDNCPSDANPEQADADADGLGDTCDNSYDAITPGFVFIPPGSFWMGSPGGEACPDGYAGGGCDGSGSGSSASELGRASHETLHYVELTTAFELQAKEVTQGEWQAVFPGWNPSHFPNCGDTCPVERVSWYDVLAYANSKSLSAGLTPCYVLTEIACEDGTSVDLPPDCMTSEQFGIDAATVTLKGVTSPYSCTGYRLPTESEWEYAYRAGGATAFHTSAGNDGAITQEYHEPLDQNLDQIGWYGGNSTATYGSAYGCSSWFSGATTCGPQPVGGKEASALGLYDMSGNVWEWCWDWYASTYPAGTLATPALDPSGPAAGSVRVWRGGSWNSYARWARGATRYSYTPGYRRFIIGFRLARSLPIDGDPDGDAIPSDGDQSGSGSDAPCAMGQTASCDDNCAFAANPDQLDTDGDGQGDACDPDDDGDTDPDFTDCAPLDAGIGHYEGEVCNGVDDDCDGTTDNGGDALCLPGYTCQSAAGCVCAPDCAGKACGDDGCGGECGTCTGIEVCEQGGCACPSTVGELTIERVDDTTRQVRLQWTISGPVDIYYITGAYQETFASSAIVSGVAGGQWIDLDAPGEQQRYYRAASAGTTCFASETVGKFDFSLTTCGPPTGCAMPVALPLLTSTTNPAEIIGAQLAPDDDVYPQSGGGLNACSYSLAGQACWPSWETGQAVWFRREEANGPCTVTLVGFVAAATQDVVVEGNGYNFFGLPYPVSLAWNQLGLQQSGAQAGPDSTTADVISGFPYVPEDQTTVDCYFHTSQQWLDAATDLPCPFSLTAGLGYWYKRRSAASLNWIVPKPYSNP